MRYVIAGIIFIMAVGCSGNEVYGAGISMKSSTDLSTIFSNGEDKVGQEFLVEGVMTEVCQKKGCWMEVKDGDESIHVVFKDYAFFMPKDGAGRNVKAQGIFTIETYEDEDADGNLTTVSYNNFVASGVILD